MIVRRICGSCRFRTACLLLALALFAATGAASRCHAAPAQPETAVDVRDGVVEVTLEMSQPIDQPLRFTPTVELRSDAASSAPVAIVDAFWDGGSTWRARFRVTKPGTYRFSASGTEQHPLTAEGTVEVTDAAPRNALRVSEDKTHLETLDGEPFFWLGDTAWNGVLRSTKEQWATYLDARSQQGFNVIQFVSTPWRGGRDTLEDPPFDLTGGKLVSANPRSLAEMDRKIRAMNDYGIVAAPIMLWALRDDDPGEALSEEDAIRLARYLLARWGAYRVVWMLGGDGRYPDPARWDRIGKAVFPASTREGMMPQLATTHPSGLNWVGDDFRDAQWLQFHGYQSGHGDGEDHLRKHLTGPWTEFPFNGHPRPVINLEPNYEAHPAYQSKQPHSPQHVRRAAYWSVLLGPTAGVTYGHNAIWVWNHEPNQVAENHGFRVDAWSAGLETGGIRSMSIMKTFFESGPWWKLRAANERLARDAPTANPVSATVVVAVATDNSWLVAYSPAGRPIELKESPSVDGQAVWFNPASGETSRATADGNRYRPPNPDKDWVLSIRQRD